MKGEGGGKPSNESKADVYTTNNIMRIPISSLIEQSVCELPKDQEAKVRKFLARFFSVAILKNVSKYNLYVMKMHRKLFLMEIEERFKKGDMQFLSNNVYGYIRHLIKYIASNYEKCYIFAKKRNVALM